MRCSVVSTTSRTTSIGGMVQLDIDNKCGWMDERRVVALFGVMVVLTADLARYLL